MPVAPSTTASAGPVGASATAASRPAEAPDPGDEERGEPVSVEQWCREILRKDRVPYRCTADAKLTPEERLTCPDEEKTKVVDGRFVLKGTGDERAVWFEVPSQKISVRLTRWTISRHYFGIHTFPRLRYAGGSLAAEMAHEQVGLCSTEGKLLASNIPVQMGRGGERTVESFALPPRTRVRIPSFRHAAPGWERMGSACDARCLDSEEACDDSCELKHADGWGVMDTGGDACKQGCLGRLDRCRQACTAKAHH